MVQIQAFYNKLVNLISSKISKIANIFNKNKLRYTLPKCPIYQNNKGMINPDFYRNLMMEIMASLEKNMSPENWKNIGIHKSQYTNM